MKIELTDEQRRQVIKAGPVTHGAMMCHTEGCVNKKAMLSCYCTPCIIERNKQKPMMVHGIDWSFNGFRDDFTREELEKISAVMEANGKRMCDSHCKRLLYSIHKRADRRIEKLKMHEAEAETEAAKAKAANLERHLRLFGWLGGNLEGMTVSEDARNDRSIATKMCDGYTRRLSFDDQNNWKYVETPPIGERTWRLGRFLDDTTMQMEMK